MSAFIRRCSRAFGRRGLRLCAALMALSMASSGLALAAPPSPTPKPSKSNKYTAQIAAASEDLMMVNVQVRRAAAKLQAAQSKLPAARRAYASAMASLTSAQRADAKATAALRAAVARAETSAKALARSDSAVHLSENQFAKLVRQIYMSGGGMLQAQVVLESQDPADLSVRIVGVDRVGRMSNRRLSSLRSIRSQNAAQAAQAKEDKAQVAKRQAAVHAQHLATKAAAAKATVAKRRVDALVAQAASAMAAAKREQKSIQAQLARLRQLQRGIDVKATKNSGGIRPGSIRWPVVGFTRISSKAGARVHPVFHTVACHAGIDIPAPKGTPIRAAAAGIVLEAASVSGYGNMTLISHGGGMATLYGHQSRFAVRTGQHVKSGQVIGYVGSTGWSTGPHLHFEVRLAGKPYNPMGWFGASKNRVACYHR
ncbi:MAG: M23 family metallopeptidase [Actinobacteria bacterium]|nr:M23 family metallopeptidase [Actinomycetota bacterium]